ncbi:hypothetical protein BJV78DRAFT_690533 [Lactifluus subvellereus]|nr:hypothetical protein BJV78DRAFT_690533 [Lactifluus subvellereus]
MDCHPQPGAYQSFPCFYPHTSRSRPYNQHWHPSPPSVESATSPGVPSCVQATTALLALREAVPLGQPPMRVRFGHVVAGDHYYCLIYVALLLQELVEQGVCTIKRTTEGFIETTKTGCLHKNGLYGTMWGIPSPFLAHSAHSEAVRC